MHYMLDLLRQKGQKIMKHNIEKASLKDSKEILNLQNEYRNNLISHTSLKEDLEDKNKIYLVAKIGSKEIVGAIGISLLVDHADIIIIITKKKYSNFGIASSLLSESIDMLKKLNIAKLFLEVRESNTPAINLYEKFKFKKISIRKNYYPNNNENALVYSLDISKI